MLYTTAYPTVGGFHMHVRQGLRSSYFVVAFEVTVKSEGVMTAYRHCRA